MNCPVHGEPMRQVPITKGNRVLGMNNFCPVEGCLEEIDVADRY